MLRLTLACLTTVACPAASAASINDLTQWTLVEDPPHPSVFTVSNTPSSTRLRAAGAVPSGVDIGFASVNGSTVAGSTDGYYFDPTKDFSIRLSTDLLLTNSVGGGAIGFGIGEDIQGRNSAGVIVTFLNGEIVALAAVSRVNDVDQPTRIIELTTRESNRLIVQYDSDTKQITLGATRGTVDDLGATIVETLDVASGWSGTPLLASFFLRSQSLGPVASLSGQSDAIFSSLQVTSGIAQSVPEPNTTVLAAFALLASWRFPSRR